MAIETKIKEIKYENKFPALFTSENRGSIILVTREIGNKLEGVCLHPKESFGQYSITWSKEKYVRMSAGSELTIRYTQE